jgi:hypothetical protein
MTSYIKMTKLLHQDTFKKFDYEQYKKNNRINSLFSHSIFR